MIFRAATLAIAVTLLLLSACGGGDDSPPTARTSFEEGELRVRIEVLDTGLLKGHAFVDAADGWIVTGLRVEANDEEDVSWPVIEPERTGIGSATAQEFFEVAIQELPRGQQITVEAIATLQNSDGSTVERRVADSWPP
ncbi:MAG: hypothetical protein ACE5FA_04975 [Dehalococcoidia bacterium]